VTSWWTNRIAELNRPHESFRIAETFLVTAVTFAFPIARYAEGP
jgi:hypothetical protein